MFQTWKKTATNFDIKGLKPPKKILEKSIKVFKKGDAYDYDDYDHDKNQDTEY